MLDAWVIGSQKYAVTEQRLDTARPSSRSTFVPKRPQREHRAERQRGRATNGHDRRQGLGQSSDDHPAATENEHCVNHPRPAVVRLPENIVDQLIKLIATTPEFPKRNKRARPRGYDHSRPEVNI